MTGPGRRSRLAARLRFMLITDGDASRFPLARAAAAAVAGGVTAVQVRVPGGSAREVLSLTREIRDVLAEEDALVLVNDRIDVALAAGADGAHLKRSSLPPSEARRILGPDLVLGVSTHDRAEVREAFEAGADYVVFGPVFSTPSKEGILDPVGPVRYGAVARTAPGPVLALGGVSRETLPSLLRQRPPGIAVVRAILAAEDPARAAREIATLLAESGGAR